MAEQDKGNTRELIAWLMILLELSDAVTFAQGVQQARLTHFCRFALPIVEETGLERVRLNIKKDVGAYSVLLTTMQDSTQEATAQLRVCILLS